MALCVWPASSVWAAAPVRLGITTWGRLMWTLRSTASLCRAECLSSLHFAKRAHSVAPCVKVLKFQITAITKPWTPLARRSLRLRLTHPIKFSHIFCWIKKTGVLYLEASRIWRLRSGLEHASRQRHLTVNQVAKFIGAHHVELHAASSCLVSHLCWVSFCTYLWIPEADGCGLPLRKNSDGSRHCCHFSLATLPFLGRRGSMLQMLRVKHMGTRES